ncbi:MAG: HDOD domain-containing protein [Rubrivivax sp.]|nr:HDOD domain-containing protein [Rubrivivax sp.]
MQSHPILDQVLIGYSPVIDSHRALVATRLIVSPDRPEAAPEGAALLAAVLDAFEPGPPQRGAGLPPLLLSLTSEPWLDGVLAAALNAPAALLIEVPAFLAADPARAQRLQALRAAGQPLAVSGQLTPEAQRSLPDGVGFRVADVQDAAAGPDLPSLPVLRSNARLGADIDAALARGDRAVIGWPMDDEISISQPAGVPPEVRGIVELMNRVERGEPAERMEAVLTSDPTLAFRLLRYLNSSAFGLRSEVTSFKHALMLLGHQRLKRWLALLLASGSKNVAVRPVMHVAARRGLIMEEMARGIGDEAMRGEMFICGVFSLLDRLLRQPMAELMRSVPVQQRVQQSLLGEGPYAQHLALVRAIEQASVWDVRETAERLMLGRGELNHALLRALSAARELD